MCAFLSIRSEEVNKILIHRHFPSSEHGQPISGCSLSSFSPHCTPPHFHITFIATPLEGGRGQVGKEAGMASHLLLLHAVCDDGSTSEMRLTVVHGGALIHREHCLHLWQEVQSGVRWEQFLLFDLLDVLKQYSFLLHLTSKVNVE